MELNRLVFAAPKSSYTVDELPNLIFIPRDPINNSNLKSTKELVHRRIHSHEIRLEDLHSQSHRSSFLCYSNKSLDKRKPIQMNSYETQVIPALYLRYTMGSNKIFIYFHANAEDLGMINSTLNYISQCMKVNVLAAEYPGYGIYKGQPNENSLNTDAEIVYDYVFKTLGFESHNIVILGRSIGSGPACQLASKKKVASLVLVAPFKSIKDVVKSTYGRIAALFVAERFRNIDAIKEIVCPILFIHGKKDTMVPFSHTLEMANVCKSIGTPCEVHSNENLGHNNIQTLNDICLPLTKFFVNLNIVIKNDVKYARSMPEEMAWKKKEGGELAEKQRKASLLKLLLEKKLKEI